MANGKSKKEVKKEFAGEEEEAEQDGDGVSSPCKVNTCSQSHLKKKHKVDLEVRLLQALGIYRPSKLRGVHRHFVIFGLTEYMGRSFGRPFTADEVLKLLGRFYNLEMLRPDEEDAEFLSQEEDFRLPPTFFAH